MRVPKILREGLLSAVLAVGGCCGLTGKMDVPQSEINVNAPVFPAGIIRIDPKSLTVPERRVYESTSEYYRGMFSEYVDYMTGVTPGGASSRELKENIKRFGREKLVLNYATINQMSFDLAMQRYKQGVAVSDKDVDELAEKVVEFTTQNFARVYTDPRHPLVRNGHREITSANSRFFRTFIERAVRNQSGPLVFVTPSPRGEELIRATFTEDEYRKHTERLAVAFGALYKGFEESLKGYNKPDAIIVRTAGPGMARKEGVATQRFYDGLFDRVYHPKKKGDKK
ncbi:MAG: hypothetical protein WCP89_00810 [archaeon]